MASVDQRIWPYASGAASSLVAAHVSKEPLKLYAGWFCPFVQRAWIVLEEKELAYQYIEINPYHKSKSFLALNPRGLVPALGCPPGPDGKEKQPLYESSVICEYLDEAYPAPTKNGVKLYPQDPYERARARIWIDHINSRIIPSFYRFCQHQPTASNPIEEVRQDFLGQLKIFIKAADPTGPFFLGDQISMVDIMLAPWLVRLWILDHFKNGGLGIPEAGEGGEDEELWKRWREWADAVAGRKSVQNTLSSRDQYISVYQRYADNTTQSEVGQATRSGRHLP